ncbi:MAG: tRNA/rRNA cytosine-C5-methylase [Cytophagaceae bacterium]|nr:tRNA/rRNA cytosine-C5-methylase [Cytophagaceae bacterium]
MTNHLPLTTPLPADFKQNILHTFGEQFSEDLCHCLDSGKGDRSIRFNTFKYHSSLNLPEVPWHDNAYLIPGDTTFAYDPSWHAGLYYVQEAASMFVQQALNTIAFDHAEPLLCLDLCAAPGGKSTLLASWLGQRGTLVSNEIIASRTEILKENTIKWGLGNTLVTNNDPTQFEALGEVFDLILVDAPCSGEGLFRRDPLARNEWSLKQVGVNVERQQNILTNAWNCLKEGGYLIYSTCTFNKEENEGQIAFLKENFGAKFVPIAIQDDWNIVQTEAQGSYRFFPHCTAGEGFALCLLRKTDSSNDGKVKYKSKAISPVQWHRKFPLSDYFDAEKSGTQAYIANEQYMALTRHQAEICQSLLHSHYIKYAGTDIGSYKQKDFIPSHALSQSIYLNAKAFEEVELTYEEAIAYLRKENVLPASTSGKGLQLVTCQQAKLGFMKLISPTRSNNYYPNEWRIRQAPVLNVQMKFILELSV